MIIFTLLNLWLSVKAPLTVDASPLPPGPTTNLTSPSYVANPSGRGTIGIIFSSIITLTLCVYTSIHLNIAAVNKMRVPCLSFRGKPIRIKRSLVYKIHWVAIALFAPEFVLYAACDQWMNARKLRDKLRKLSAKGKNKSEGENEPFIGTRATEEGEDWELEDLSNGVAQESEGKKVGDWSNVSMVSAFFVVMGGFAYQKSDIGLHRDGDYPHAILTPLGFLHLATHGYLDPSILNDNSISDRSKADWLGKLLVCAQALWMVVNCIARKAAGLPNTLIELNVVVHVVFTVIVYAIWWKKPLNINEPIVLSLVGKENDVTAPVNLDRLIPEHIVAVSGRDGLIMGLKGVRISLQATKSGFVYEARHSRHIPVDNSDSDSDGEDSETRSNNPTDQAIEIPAYNPRINNLKYADLLGYEIELPENLNLSIFTLPKEMQKSKFHKKNKPLEDKQRYIDAIQALGLNEKSNPKGLILLRGQFLYWNDHLTVGCHCLSDAVFLSEQQLLLLTRLHAYHDLRDDPEPGGGIGKNVNDEKALVTVKHKSHNKYGNYIIYKTQCAIPDPSNYQVNGPVSSWSPEPMESPMIWGLFTFLGVIYAVCHLTAWNGHFPSFYERLFWRISCIVIATGGPACVILLLLVGCFRPELSTPSSFSRASRPSTPSTHEGDGQFVQATSTALAQQKHPTIALEKLETESTVLNVFQNIYDYITTFFFLIPLVVLYVLSRAFIVVEAFISMRCLPAGAYETVDWSQFVPHL